ncbi:MAG: YdcF family protein [Oscillospiraceae bacterium]|nr:YdcF family protein [Oscillospiraceae bacterium]
MNILRFDTRDKKPKLFHLLPLAAVGTAAVVLLSLGGPERHAAAICAITALFCLITFVELLRAWLGQLQYNPYSYNTIYYMGFALFDLSVFVTNVILCLRILRMPELYTAESVLHTLLNSAKRYMLLSAPFVLIFSGALIVSNISLIRHEGKRIVNLLGILLAFLMLAGEIFLFRFDYYVSGSLAQVRLHELFGNLFAALYLYCECMLIGAVIAGTLVVRYEPEKDKDFIIVLGCGLRRDGSPTPLLRGRLDRALTFAERQKAETGKEAVFIVSGGRGPDEVMSESASMKRYLTERGVQEERIVEEDLSSSTFENMKFSLEKIKELDTSGKVAFATTNYHVFRSGLFARRVKMRAVGMGAKTKWYFWPNASVREFVGLLTEHRLKQGLILSGMIIFYVALTLLVYR